MVASHDPTYPNRKGQQFFFLFLCSGECQFLKMLTNSRLLHVKGHAIVWGIGFPPALLSSFLLSVSVNMIPVKGCRNISRDKVRFADPATASQQQECLNSLIHFRPDFLVVDGENWGHGDYHFHIKAEFILR
jgi:hypothetical protein